MKLTPRHLLLALLWAAVAAYVIHALGTARRHRVGCVVSGIEIDIADSSAQGCLVSAGRVREWIDRSGIPTTGVPVGEVNLSGIEELIARNGFVDRTAAWVSYSGLLHIRISQREPLVRLLLDGMNAYSTDEGFVFAAPRSASLYVPVVTGPYRPPFPSDYTGDVRGHVDAEIQRIGERIATLEMEKYPFYRRERQNDRNIAALRRRRTKRRWWRLERAEAFEQRVDELRKEKASLRRRYRYEARLLHEEIARIDRQQAAERARQKKLEKSYEDFMKLLTFVERIEEDAFWRSEVVQIIAQTAPSGALEVSLIPRSGRHTILFGRLEQVDEKFDKLLRFYRKGLSSIGWESYRTIDIRYEGQVVCKK